MSASPAEAMVRLLQDHLHVATFLEENRQWRVFTEVAWPGPSSRL